MYRLLLIIAICLKAASSAPQTKDSDVTYVKIQPVVEDAPVEAASNIRESRIEKLPLTIPGNVSKASKEPDKNPTENLEIKSELSQNISEPPEIKADLPDNKSDLPENKPNLSENKSDLSANKSDLSANKSDLAENLESSESKQSDILSDASGTDDSNTTDDLSDITPTEDLSESESENLSDTIPSETYQSDRRARNFDSIETTETTDDVTEKYEDELFDHTVIEAPRTRAPPKFVPKGSKLSYFQKPRSFHSYSSANQVENLSKRRFVSRCSCQKIWNCPKLQITVPRCPDEYFLCCF